MKSEACRHPIIEALVSGIIKGFSSQVFPHELRLRREFYSYNKIRDIHVEANDEPHLFLSRIGAVLYISTALEPPA